MIGSSLSKWPHFNSAYLCYRGVYLFCLHCTLIILILFQVELAGLTGHISFDSGGFRSNFTLDIVELKKEGLVKVGTWNKELGSNFTRNYTESYLENVANLENQTLKITTILVRVLSILNVAHSYGHSLMYGYWIGPMKMRSLWEGKTHLWNAASLLNFWHCWKKIGFFNTENLGSIKGLQSYSPSNFEKDLTPGELECGPISSSGAGAGRQTFSWDLQLWQLVTLQPFDLSIPNFQHLKI